MQLLSKSPYLIFSGVLDEKVSADKLIAAIADYLHDISIPNAFVPLDLSRVRRGNSLGLRTLKQATRKNRIAYINTPIWLVDIFSIEPKFLKPEDILYSFRAGFIDERKNVTYERVITLGKDIPLKESYCTEDFLQRNEYNDILSPDFFADTLLRFLKKHLDFYRTALPLFEHQIDRLLSEEKLLWNAVLAHPNDPPALVRDLQAQIESASPSNTLARVISELESQIKDRERLQALLRTTQILAHDVKRPFRILESILAAQPTARAKSQLEEVRSALADVTALIDDVMDVDSPSSLHLEPTAPIDLLRDAISESAIIWETKQPNVKLESVFKSSRRINADRRRLKRVLLNILGNALEAMDFQGKLWFHIEDTQLPTGVDGVSITIGNDGQPIPVEILPHLFDAFFTHGKKSGTGLGLAVAKQIVTAHGGTIACLPLEPRGVEFCLTLPAIEGTSALADCEFPTMLHNSLTSNVPTNTSTSHPPSPSLRIAILDDSRAILTVWQARIKDIEILTFLKPEDFLKQCEHQPDFLKSLTCIVTDGSFGNSSSMTGLDLGYYLKEKLNTTCPVVLFSERSYLPTETIGRVDVAILKRLPSQELLTEIFEILHLGQPI